MVNSLKKFIENLKILLLNFFRPKEILFGLLLLFISTISFIYLIYLSSLLFKEDRIIYRGTLTEGVLGIPKVTNPYTSLNQAEKDLSTLLFSPLIKNLDGDKFELALASKVETDSAKTQIKVYLEEDAKFSNGNSIETDDVITSLQNIPIEKNFSIEKIDSKIFNINVKKNFEGNPLTLLTYPVIPRAENFEGVYSKNLITSSPLYVYSTTYDGNGNLSEIVLKRFDNGEEKLPYLKYFKLRFYIEETEALSALQRGEIDTLSGIPGKVISKLKSDNSIKLNTAELPNNFALFINQNKNDALKSNSLRRILSDVLDREILVNQVLGGFGIPSQNILNKTEKPKTPEEVLKNLPSLLSYENGVLYITESKTDSSDKKKNTEENSPVKISITTINNRELIETAEFLATTWKKIGVETTIKKIDRKELQTVVKDRDFDILLFGLSIKNNADYYSFFSSKERNYPKLNISNYTNKKVDTYVENLQTEKNEKNISELKQDLSLELENDMPIIMLYKPLFVQAVGSMHTLSLPTFMQNEEDRYRFYKNWYLYTEKVLKFFVGSSFIDKLDRLFN
jgi:ABC-type transport system substrate-binding protein